ncbi:helix-turn-helix domain-containing protein [Plastoroseomonas hellenica]|uniref:Helix-turn-helix transcriptional regulator n=1 Tax=Plastoroseomonas hellenica TaxID=2687306 RepID=A0ABS5EWX2_9PROT|nr:helix-turn-helix transcriptional regulator [Plastoroseomonas hellenica]MBR0641350.1 helix-turn-helix transcriptional regulator [Plastoroseomonas hellenica]MBR0664799.1 helix-turn-helix transcriptional regulator [Plastoroseomonas hellenica]
MDVSPVDRHIAARLRERRLLLGLSQVELATLIGVSYQQLQKYETGANRIAAGRLYEIARSLRTPVASFYDGLDRWEAHWSSHHPLVQELVQSFAEIGDAAQQQAVIQMIRALAPPERRAA